ncbi:hypothetical protein GG496_001497 [Candidatus Fervidibacteria bacterium JGI MDM2 JNZ-1-D12]
MLEEEQVVEEVLCDMYQLGKLHDILDVLVSAVDEKMDPAKALSAARQYLRSGIWDQYDLIGDDAIFVGTVIVEAVRRITKQDLKWEIIPDYDDLAQANLSFYLIIATHDLRLIPSDYGELYWFCNPKSFESVLSLIRRIALALNTHAINPTH